MNSLSTTCNWIADNYIIFIVAKFCSAFGNRSQLCSAFGLYHNFQDTLNRQNIDNCNQQSKSVVPSLYSHSLPGNGERGIKRQVGAQARSLWEWRASIQAHVCTAGLVQVELCVCVLTFQPAAHTSQAVYTHVLATGHASYWAMAQ